MYNSLMSTLQEGAKTFGRQRQPRTQMPDIQMPNSTGALREGDKTGLGTVTTRFGGQTRYEPKHPGIDIAAPLGAAGQFFAPGKVTEVEMGHKQGEPRSYGNYVVVQDAYGNKHRYSHLTQSWVKVGDTVQAGQKGYAIGNTGSSYSTSGGTGSHLDYRIMDANRRYLDPSPYVKSIYG